MGRKKGGKGKQEGGGGDASGSKQSQTSESQQKQVTPEQQQEKDQSQSGRALKGKEQTEPAPGKGQTEPPPGKGQSEQPTETGQPGQPKGKGKIKGKGIQEGGGDPSSDNTSTVDSSKQSQTSAQQKPVAPQQQQEKSQKPDASHQQHTQGFQKPQTEPSGTDQPGQPKGKGKRKGKPQEMSQQPGPPTTMEQPQHQPGPPPAWLQPPRSVQQQQPAPDITYRPGMSQQPGQPQAWRGPPPPGLPQPGPPQPGQPQAWRGPQQPGPPQSVHPQPQRLRPPQPGQPQQLGPPQPGQPQLGPPQAWIQPQQPGQPYQPQQRQQQQPGRPQQPGQPQFVGKQPEQSPRGQWQQPVPPGMSQQPGQPQTRRQPQHPEQPQARGQQPEQSPRAPWQQPPPTGFGPPGLPQQHSPSMVPQQIPVTQGMSQEPPQMGTKPKGKEQAPQQQPGQQGRPTQQPQGKGQAQQSKGDSATGLTQQFSKMSTAPEGDIKPMDFIKAKPGIKGRKIPVESNHLQLNLGKLQTAIHYDVAIDPDTPKKFLRKVMELFRVKYYPQRYPAFDGRKNLYSSNLLPFGRAMKGDVVYREADGREKPYKVEIKFAKEVDLRALQNIEMSKPTPRDALQVVDIVLRSAPAASLISVGQSFFLKPQQIIDLGEGMEMYHGFYQSAIRGWKPFLNVDVAHKAFPKNTCAIDALCEVLSSGYRPFNRDDLNAPLRRHDEEAFEKFIKQLRVIYEIPGQPSSKRGYRVNGLDQSAIRKQFTLDGGQKTTIDQYFQKQKRYKLRYPHLPTLWVGDRQRENRILLPMELCTLEEGQVLNRKMTENQTANMIKSSATNTDVRKQKIRNGIQSANYNNHPSIREFGFSVSNDFEKLQARVLDPPKLEYRERRQVLPGKGVWRNDKFWFGATIKKWTIALADRRPPRNDDLNRLEEELFRQAGMNGLIMESRAEKPFSPIGETLDQIKQYFLKQKNNNYDVIFVVVPNSGPQYSYVKTSAEIVAGCLTQCIKSRTVQRINSQTAVNILLKVNAKLNGTNHCMANRPLIMNVPTMIMGADVTHPSPDARDIPSVAAVTASHDPKAFRYNICWRLQPPKQEIIDDLENITIEHLKYFHKENKGQKPHRIIFFRDGVSEGQFDEVRRAEIRAIRSACKKLQPDGYEPAVTFLVVQKRHHTRLFPLNPRDSQDRNNNVPAGTCVDTQITHPFMQDFYLVSHASIQGVAKPTKYCSLWDENKMSNDDIEELTYFLCHMFTRCNRSVSYPAPTYYAHLAAARAKVYIEHTHLDLNNLRKEYEKFQIQEVIRKGKPMFFV